MKHVHILGTKNIFIFYEVSKQPTQMIP